MLVNELLPQLQAASPSRVVIVTSAAYALGKIEYNDINLDKVGLTVSACKIPYSTVCL